MGTLRRLVGLGLIGVLAGPAAAQAPPLAPPAYQADYDFLWETVRDNYAYFDRKQTDWNLVRAPKLTRYTVATPSSACLNKS